MSSCELCEILKEEKNVLYEDSISAVIAPKAQLTQGHLIVLPKIHNPILEEVTDDVVSHCFLVANKTSSAVFEAANSAGTNIIVQNGIPAGQTKPHFCLHVIPRREDDGLNFKWPPKKQTDQKMNEIHALLKDECDYFNQPIEEKKEVIEKKEEKRMVYTEDNYLIKQLKRIP